MSSLPPALLTYAVTPTSVPEGTGVELELAVANATGAYVPCTQIVFTLPTSGSDALTADPGAIVASPAAGTNWSIVGDGAGNFTATPSGRAGLAKDASIAFLFTHVQVVTELGLSPLGVVETSGQPPAARAPAVQLAVERAKQGLAITSFIASPIAVCPDSQVTLAWSTTGATKCTLSSPGASSPVSLQDASYPVHPEVATTYTLEATNGSRHVREDISVAVLAPQIVNFSADPGDVGAAGNPSKLSWLVVDADTATIKPDVGGVDPNGGSLVVKPVEPTLYSLEAVGCGVTHSATAYVDVDPVKIVSFTGPALLFAGDSGPLTWQTTAASSVSIDEGVGTFGPNGSTPVTPAQTTTYMLLALGYKPEQASTTIPVVPAITSLRCEVGGIEGWGEVDGGVTVIWTTVGANGVTLNGTPYGPTGQVNFQFSGSLTVAFVAQGAGTAATALVSAATSGSGGRSQVEAVEFAVTLTPAASGLNAPGQNVSAALDLDPELISGYQGVVSNSDGYRYPFGSGVTQFAFPSGAGQGGVAQWSATMTGTNGDMTGTLTVTLP